MRLENYNVEPDKIINNDLHFFELNVNILDVSNPTKGNFSAMLDEYLQ